MSTGKDIPSDEFLRRELQRNELGLAYAGDAPQEQEATRSTLWHSTPFNEHEEGSAGRVEGPPFSSGTPRVWSDEVIQEPGWGPSVNAAAMDSDRPAATTVPGKRKHGVTSSTPTTCNRGGGNGCERDLAVELALPTSDVPLQRRSWNGITAALNCSTILDPSRSASASPAPRVALPAALWEDTDASFEASLATPEFAPSGRPPAVSALKTSRRHHLAAAVATASLAPFRRLPCDMLTPSGRLPPQRSSATGQHGGSPLPVAPSTNDARGNAFRVDPDRSTDLQPLQLLQLQQHKSYDHHHPHLQQQLREAGRHELNTVAVLGGRAQRTAHVPGPDGGATLEGLHLIQNRYVPYPKAAMTACGGPGTWARTLLAGRLAAARGCHVLAGGTDHGAYGYGYCYGDVDNPRYDLEYAATVRPLHPSHQPLQLERRKVIHVDAAEAALHAQGVPAVAAETGTMTQAVPAYGGDGGSGAWTQEVAPVTGRQQPYTSKDSAATAGSNDLAVAVAGADALDVQIDIMGANTASGRQSSSQLPPLEEYRAVLAAQRGSGSLGLQAGKEPPPEVAGPKQDETAADGGNGRDAEEEQAADRREMGPGSMRGDGENVAPVDGNGSGADSSVEAGIAAPAGVAGGAGVPVGVNLTGEEGIDNGNGEALGNGHAGEPRAAHVAPNKGAAVGAQVACASPQPNAFAGDQVVVAPADVAMDGADMERECPVAASSPRLAVPEMVQTAALNLPMEAAAVSAVVTPGPFGASTGGASGSGCGGGGFCGAALLPLTVLHTDRKNPKVLAPRSGRVGDTKHLVLPAEIVQALAPNVRHGEEALLVRVVVLPLRQVSIEAGTTAVADTEMEDAGEVTDQVLCMVGNGPGGNRALQIPVSERMFGRPTEFFRLNPNGTLELGLGERTQPLPARARGVPAGQRGVIDATASAVKPWEGESGATGAKNDEGYSEDEDAPSGNESAEETKEAIDEAAPARHAEKPGLGKWVVIGAQGPPPPGGRPRLPLSVRRRYGAKQNETVMRTSSGILGRLKHLPVPPPILEALSSDQRTGAQSVTIRVVHLVKASQAPPSAPVPGTPAADAEADAGNVPGDAQLQAEIRGPASAAPAAGSPSSAIPTAVPSVAAAVAPTMRVVKEEMQCLVGNTGSHGCASFKLPVTASMWNRPLLYMTLQVDGAVELVLGDVVQSAAPPKVSAAVAAATARVAQGPPARANEAGNDGGRRCRDEGVGEASGTRVRSGIRPKVAGEVFEAGGVELVEEAEDEDGFAARRRVKRQRGAVVKEMAGEPGEDVALPSLATAAAAALGARGISTAADNAAVAFQWLMQPGGGFAHDGEGDGDTVKTWREDAAGAAGSGAGLGAEVRPEGVAGYGLSLDTLASAAAAAAKADLLQQRQEPQRSLPAALQYRPSTPLTQMPPQQQQIQRQLAQQIGMQRQNGSVTTAFTAKAAVGDSGDHKSEVGASAELQHGPQQRILGDGGDSGKPGQGVLRRDLVMTAAAPQLLRRQCTNHEQPVGSERPPSSLVQRVTLTADLLAALAAAGGRAPPIVSLVPAPWEPQLQRLRMAPLQGDEVLKHPVFPLATTEPPRQRRSAAIPAAAMTGLAGMVSPLPKPEDEGIVGAAGNDRGRGSGSGSVDGSDLAGPPAPGGDVHKPFQARAVGLLAGAGIRSLQLRGVIPSGIGSGDAGDRIGCAEPEAHRLPSLVHPLQHPLQHRQRLLAGYGIGVSGTGDQSARNQQLKHPSMGQRVGDVGPPLNLDSHLGGGSDTGPGGGPSSRPGCGGSPDMTLSALAAQAAMLGRVWTLLLQVPRVQLAAAKALSSVRQRPAEGGCLGGEDGAALLAGFRGCLAGILNLLNSAREAAAMDAAAGQKHALAEVRVEGGGRCGHNRNRRCLLSAAPVMQSAVECLLEWYEVLAAAAAEGTAAMCAAELGSGAALVRAQLAEALEPLFARPEC